MAYLPSSCNPITSNRITSISKVPTLSVDPLTYPVTLEEAKKWIKMDLIEDDDDVIQQIIFEAVDWLEEYCGISVVENTVTSTVTIHNRQYLPYPPVKAVTNVYVNNTTEITDWTGNPNFTGLPGETMIQGYGTYKVVAKCGYDVLPAKLKGALLAYIAFAYEHRGDNLDENDTNFAPVARAKAQSYIQAIAY